mgnify:CR=1 FL=1
MFQIIVDSAANIPAELVKKYKIKVLSFINFVKKLPVLIRNYPRRKNAKKAMNITTLCARVQM